MGEDSDRVERIDQKVNRLDAKIDKAVDDRVEVTDRLGVKMDDIVDGFAEQRDRRAVDSERIAKLEVHTEHLVKGQASMEGKIDKLLNKKINGGKRFTLFGGGALAAVGGAIGAGLAWLKT